MSRIVKSHGVNVTDDVFKLHEDGPAFVSAPTPAPAPAAAATSNTEGHQPFVIPEHVVRWPAEEGGEEEIHPMAQELVQNAMDEAARILEQAVQESEARKAEILAQARYEAEKMKQNALEQGRKEGAMTTADEVRQAVNKLEAAIARFEGDRAGFEQEYEDGMKWMSLEIASKILAKRITGDDADMLQMVEKAVHTVEKEPWVRVEVAQDMTRLLAGLENTYREFGNVELVPTSAPHGSVQIETPSGVMDISVATQLENLKNYFRKQNR